MNTLLTYYLKYFLFPKFIFHVWYCCLAKLLNKVHIDLLAWDDEDVLPKAHIWLGLLDKSAQSKLAIYYVWICHAFTSAKMTPFNCDYGEIKQLLQINLKYQDGARLRLSTWNLVFFKLYYI